MYKLLKCLDQLLIKLIYLYIFNLINTITAIAVAFLKSFYILKPFHIFKQKTIYIPSNPQQQK